MEDEGMKLIASMLIGALFVGASFGVAMAQEGTAPANPPAAAAATAADHADEVAAFHRVLQKHDLMWQRLKQDPSLVSNSEFVAQYNDLQLFFNSYQGSKQRFLADPGLYLKMNEAKAMHREQTRGPGE
jgi:hypothetical protein